MGPWPPRIALGGLCLVRAGSKHASSGTLLSRTSSILVFSDWQCSLLRNGFSVFHCNLGAVFFNFCVELCVFQCTSVVVLQEAYARFLQWRLRIACLRLCCDSCKIVVEVLRQCSIGKT